MQKRMRQLGIGILATGLGVALFVFLVFHAGIGNIVKNLAAFGIVPFIFFVFLSLINFGLYTLRWKIILEEVEKGRRVSYTRLFLHRMSGFAAGYLTPAAQVAGEPVRVALLATEGISSNTATSSVVLDLAFEISAFLVYVILGIAFALSFGVGAETLGVVALLALVGVVMFMTLFFVSVMRGWNMFQALMGRPFFAKHPRAHEAMEWLGHVERSMTQFFTGRARVLFFVILLSCLMTGFRGVEIWFIAHGFGESLSFSGAILLSTIPGLVLFLPIPGGLGLFEASMSAMLGALGIAIPALAFTMIIRLRDFIFIGIGVLHGIREGIGWMGKKR